MVWCSIFHRKISYAKCSLLFLSKKKRLNTDKSGHRESDITLEPLNLIYSFLCLQSIVDGFLTKIVTFYASLLIYIVRPTKLTYLVHYYLCFYYYFNENLIGALSHVKVKRSMYFLKEKCTVSIVLPSINYVKLFFLRKC